MHEVPPHYRATIKALLRFALVGLCFGVGLGIWWTGLRKQLHFVEHGHGPVLYDSDAAKAELAAEGFKSARVGLPPGFLFEAGMDLKFAHGHVILLTGVLPLVFAAALHLCAVYGGKPIARGKLVAFFWFYVPGAAGAATLMAYKGLVQFQHITAGEFDLSAIDKGMFLGSRALRGASYGISHTILAIGLGILVHGLWQSSGGIATEAASPPPAA